MFVSEVVAPAVCDMHKETQLTCKDEGKTRLISIVEVIKLFKNVFYAKRNNAKLVGRANDLQRELKNVLSVEKLACVNSRVKSARVKSFETQGVENDAKYVKLVHETGQTEEDPWPRISLLDLLLKAGRDCTALLEKDRSDIIVRDKYLLGDPLGAYVAAWCQIHERKEALGVARGVATAVSSQLDSLHYNATDV